MRPDGATLADHYAQLEGTTGKLPEGAYKVHVPYEGEFLWSIFWELSAGRGGSGFGPNPIRFEDIKCWMELSGTELIFWEVSALKAMDGAYIYAFEKQSAAQQSK